ncbi:hypothetical protein [Chiayiivirga flava]|uniref:Delta-60 repeat domain-containing protein n=1 Tax=Chiayiivirga flava TaxID=659595 RepID=A0A7W8FZC7_9GAMM|nr:hypothetical protein [Chiayiivirga flava]MBB5208312.1 hypothetical protein [Chiayiivirga flava]
MPAPCLRFSLPMLLVVCLLLPGALRAQVLEPLPDLRLTINGSVNAIARLPDGRMLIGGDFTRVDGVPRGRAARLQADGTLDPLWNPDVSDGSVTAIVADAGTGAVFLGGTFQTVGGLYRNNIARITGATGGVDAGWSADTNGSVTSLALDGDGALFVAGVFNQIGGTARTGLARLSASSGAVDAQWNPGVDGIPFVLLVDSATASLYVGGQLSGVAGTPRANLAKLSTAGTGVLDADWNPAPDDSVMTLAVDDSDAIFVGGQFSTIGGQAHRGLARVAAGGSAAVDAGWTPAAQGTVYAIAATDDALFIGGSFQTVNDVPQRRLARILRSGTGASDASWRPEPDDVVHALAVSAAGRLLAGGRFLAIDAQECAGLALLSAEADLVAALDVERAGRVLAIETQADGGVLLGGAFFRADGERRDNLLRLRPDGTLDSQWTPGTDGEVLALASDAARNVYAAGRFRQIGGHARVGLAKIAANGAVDAAWAPMPNSDVLALAVRGPHVYAGGYFGAVSGQPRRGVVRIASGDGAVDPDWNPALNPGATVYAIAVDRDSTVYLGGYFDSVGASLRSNIARVSALGVGGVDPAWNPGADGEVRTLALTAAHVYAGGNFSLFGGAPRTNLARLGRNGVLDAGWNPGAEFGYVDAIAIDAARGVYVGGAFGAVGGLPRQHLARIDATGSVDPTWNPQPDGHVAAVRTQGERIHVGGAFDVLSGESRSAVASYRDASLAEVLTPFYADGFEP